MSGWGVRENGGRKSTPRRHGPDDAKPRRSCQGVEIYPKR